MTLALRRSCGTGTTATLIFVAKNNDLLVLTMHISHPPDPIEQVVPGLSPSLAALVMRMLHKSPTDRPTMPAVAEQLLAMDAGAGAHAGRRISRTALPVLTAQPGLTSHSASGAGTAPSQPSGSGLGGHSDAGLGSRGGPADGLTVSTLAQGAGQRLQGGTRAGGGLRRAVPLLALAAVAIGGVVVVSAVRSSSPAGPATSREEPRGSPTSKPLPRTTDPTPMTNSPLGRDGSAAADGKTGSAGTKPAKPRPADGKAAAADKLRKKNAAPTGKTTPLIR